MLLCPTGSLRYQANKEPSVHKSYAQRLAGHLSQELRIIFKCFVAANCFGVVNAAIQRNVDCEDYISHVSSPQLRRSPSVFTIGQLPRSSSYASIGRSVRTSRSPFLRTHRNATVYLDKQSVALLRRETLSTADGLRLKAPDADYLGDSGWMDAVRKSGRVDSRKHSSTY